MNGDEGIKQNTERGEGIEGEKMVESSEDRSRYSRSEKIKESPPRVGRLIPLINYR
jgi:hypothetical protein